VSLSRRVADCLNVVSIGIENESAVVVRVVVRAKARGPIVLAARRESGSDASTVDLSFATKAMCSGFSSFPSVRDRKAHVIDHNALRDMRRTAGAKTSSRQIDSYTAATGNVTPG
jgi:hypothetical protein